ncbi:hypothetical protein TPA0910_33490 [Streptomyces hygroscopicus subsp. sporocinereus]|uniref:Uncharacterized protein n=1 Tax=Streptomyces hygroscopicus TaxID=1912 RepID=A0ABQ3TZW0_STRHY|nr:hypothetical protein TPA0910_33490 [Streptomyces hygroscopicus]
MLQIKRFLGGYPGGVPTPAVRLTPGHPPTEAATGTHTNAPDTRQRRRTPHPPPPLLNRAEGAKRNPHPTTGRTASRPVTRSPAAGRNRPA